VSNEDSKVMRTLMVVLAVLVFLALSFYGLAQLVSSTDSSKQVASIESKANIKRVSRVATKVVVRGGKSAEEMGAVCFGCHNSGVGGAPKIGDTAIWKARAKTGMDTMVAIVVKGKGIMAPRGGTKLSDADIKKVIKHMMTKSGVK